MKYLSIVFTLRQGEEYEILTMIPFSIKNTQYIGISQIKDVQDLLRKSRHITKKKFKTTYVNGEICHIPRHKDPIL